MAVISICFYIVEGSYYHTPVMNYIINLNTLTDPVVVSPSGAVMDNHIDRPQNIGAVGR